MIALIILIAVILILLVPIHIYVEFGENGFLGFARILFFKYRFQKQQKKDIKKASKTEVKKEKNKGNLETFKSLISPVSKTLGKLIRLISFNRILADISLAGRDAYQTAMIYGGACAGVSAILPFLENNLRIKKKSISINADFETGQSQIYFETDISVCIYKLIFLAIYFLLKYKEKRGLENG